MKAITIDFYGTPAKYTLLENLDDVLAYSEFHMTDVELAAARMIRSDLPPERFDHLGSNDRVGGIVAGAVTKCSVTGGSPVLECGAMALDKIRRLCGFILDGRQIMVNRVGGFRFLDDSVKVLESSDCTLERDETHVINENTTYINLENDADLEQHTIDHLSKLDPNFSYVTELRNYEWQSLVDVFQEFKENGGRICYVYTTGGDIKQIESYCRALKRAGIDEVHFEFNAGITQELQATLDRLSLKVKLIGN